MKYEILKKLVEDKQVQVQEDPTAKPKMGVIAQMLYSQNQVVVYMSEHDRVGKVFSEDQVHTRESWEDTIWEIVEEKNYHYRPDHRDILLDQYWQRCKSPHQTAEELFNKLRVADRGYAYMDLKGTKLSDVVKFLQDYISEIGDLEMVSQEDVRGTGKVLDFAIHRNWDKGGKAIISGER